MNEEMIREAITSGNWSQVLLALDDLLAESEVDLRSVTRYIGQVAAALEQVTPQKDLDAQAQRLADWLFMSADQAATVANNRGATLTWRTRRDDRVREVHRHMEGASVEAGQPFEMGGTLTYYPGMPVGDPSLWYNCRCRLEVETLTAALEPDTSTHDGAAIVLLPADGEPIEGVGPEIKHLTLVYLGEQEFDEQDEPALREYAHSLSQAIEVPVRGMDTLGEDGEAQVAMLAPEVPTQVRDGLLEVLQTLGMEDASQWPNYVPHITLGYIPEGEQGEVLDLPESVTFDKMAVWSDGNRVGWDLGGAEKEQSESAEEVEPEEVMPAEAMMFHGVMVTEGVPTDADMGPARIFEPNSLTWREPPLTLTYEHVMDGMRTEVLGHIDRIWRLESDPNKIAYEGGFDDTAVADERIGQIANGTLTRVSIHTGALDGAIAEDESAVTFTTGRIAGLAIVPMPGFEDAYIALGPWPDEEPEAAEEELVAAVSEKSWDGSASRFDEAQWKRSCIVHVCDGEEKSCHKLPIREPDGALSRAGVHAAAARLNQVDASPEQITKAKASLRSAYKELGEEAPEVITASAEQEEIDATRAHLAAMAESRSLNVPVYEPMEQALEGRLADLAWVGDFKRGAGWVTDPVATRRIHRYWTEPGQPGYAKIGWGAPNDFYRCRSHLAKYIDPIYLNRTCAQWHHDALGVWPGQHSVTAALYDATYAPLPDALPRQAREALRTAERAGVLALAGADDADLDQAAESVRSDVGTPGRASGDLGGPSSGVREGVRADPAGTNSGSPVREHPVPESGPPGSGHSIGERAATVAEQGSAGDLSAWAQQLGQAAAEERWADLLAALSDVSRREGASASGRMRYRALGIWPGEHSVGGAMTASALPETYSPPLEWFSNPSLPFATPLTITAEGHIFGHLAAWDQCHVSYGEAAGRCVLAPHSATEYSFFRLGRVLTDGGEVNVGQIVLGGPHAREGANLTSAQDFYASTSRAVADIAVGEDQHGIWFSGAVRPGISSDDLYALRAAKLSGDWRRVRGNLELVAALAVNVPGFPVPETALVASAGGEIMSLTAAGVVVDEPDEAAYEQAIATASQTAHESVVREVLASIDRIQAARAAKNQFRPLRAEHARALIEKG